MSDQNDTVGRHPPAPIVFAGLFAVGIGLDRFLPPVGFGGAARVIGWILAIGGLVGVGLPAVSAQRGAGTSPNPNRPTTALVVTGPYRFTRNPIYLAMALVYTGIALAVVSVGALALMPVAMAIVNWNAKREEAYLERRFGDAYRAYKVRVRRWL